MDSPSAWQVLDRTLRGDYLTRDALRSGDGAAPARQLIGLALLLGAIYGLGVGGYAAFRGADRAWMQLLASAMKVPLLFLLTLLVTFPSLYVFAALQRLPLDMRNTLRLLLMTIVVHLTILASLAPVFAFFAASTESYAFMLVLNVLFFVIGGLLGLMVLRKATNAMFTPTPNVEEAKPEAAADASAPWPAGGPPPGSPPVAPRAAATLRQRDGSDRARRLLGLWGLVYGVVGAQMGWLLRPFLGSPDLPFTWFRPREDNVLVGILRALRAMFQ
jgi:hypothetical protein